MSQILRDVPSKVFEAAHSLYWCLHIIPFIAVRVGKSSKQDMEESIPQQTYWGDRQTRVGQSC